MPEKNLAIAPKNALPNSGVAVHSSYGYDFKRVQLNSGS